MNYSNFFQCSHIFKYVVMFLIFVSTSNFKMYPKLYDFKINGIAYTIKDIDNMEVFVANDNDESEINPVYANGYRLEKSSYSGNIIIPEVVNFEELCFKVIGIGIGAFLECEGITAVELPGTINTTEGWSFYGCTSIKSMHLPEDLHKIGQADFADCSSLSEIAMSEKTDTLASGAFSGCKSLKHINLPQTLKCIENGVFSYSGIRRIEISEGMTFLGEKAVVNQDGGPFSKCDNLESVVLPKSLTGIVNWAFSSSPNLKTIVCQNPNFPINDVYQRIDYLFYGDNIQYILVPQGASKDYNQWPGIVITYSDKDSVSDLGKTIIYNNIEYTIVNSNSEYNVYIDSPFTNQESVNIFNGFDYGESHYNITGISKTAFVDNTNLRSVYVYNEDPIFIYDTTFDKLTYLLGKLYVPYGYKEIYTTAPGWRNFKTIEEFDAASMFEIGANSHEHVEVGRYNLNGQKVSEDYDGIVIVRYSDGSTRKMIQK